MENQIKLAGKNPPKDLLEKVKIRVFRPLVVCFSHVSTENKGIGKKIVRISEAYKPDGLCRRIRYYTLLLFHLRNRMRSLGERQEK